MGGVSKWGDHPSVLGWSQDVVVAPDWRWCAGNMGGGLDLGEGTQVDWRRHGGGHGEPASYPADFQAGFQHFGGGPFANGGVVSVCGGR